MAGPTVEIEGADTFARTMGSATDGLQDWSEPGRKGAAVIQTRARADAPRLTGFLANSHTTRVDASSFEVGNAAEYARKIYYTVRPWLTDVAANTADQWLDIYRDRVVDLMGRVRGA